MKQFSEVGRLRKIKRFVSKRGNFKGYAISDRKPVKPAEHRSDVVRVAGRWNNHASRTILDTLQTLKR